ncbi:uncharacterized protein LOC144059168 [Vanacampus margaritifer]
MTFGSSSEVLTPRDEIPLQKCKTLSKVPQLEPITVIDWMHASEIERRSQFHPPPLAPHAFGESFQTYGHCLEVIAEVTRHAECNIPTHLRVIKDTCFEDVNDIKMAVLREFKRLSNEGGAEKAAEVQQTPGGFFEVENFPKSLCGIQIAG